MASHADAGHATQDTSARSSPEYLELLAKVAHLYYEQGLNQRQIAAQIDRHASTISRLLEEARSEGIVRISVQYPWRSDDELASRLAATFQLRHAHVLLSEGMPYQKMVDGLGVIAARVLAGALHDGTILGVSWGSAVHSSIQALRVPTPVRVTVVQMCGAVGASVTGGVELPRMAAERCGGTYRYLPAPVAVKDPRLAQSLLAEPMVDEVLQLAARADVALVGIGSINPQVSQWLRNGYADSFELTELEQLGYVGDVCGRFFTAEGDVLDSELNQRVIAVPAERLRGIPHVIGVAGGELKVPAIRGALRARLINSLVTDSSAARQLLAMP
jgi:DNA-binding transcriptional regulator LsrR (DeoR family)